MATGLFGWSPAAFMDSTPHEFAAAFEEFAAFHSPSDKPTVNPMTRDEMDEMIRQDEARRGAKS